ncbi:hypothetical protein FA95DRAFT_1566694 [Auriscalpium vulgare]|uniref:Uncharacterized protein n=1 Tax=Auriscalpium vulgare TaxID=40419 RepID=A0ACB8R912_9AGAM|nr:hypothetical protein FA95DRAFT_1566694 [Auriscalpium vulgare]
MSTDAQATDTLPAYEIHELINLAGSVYRDSKGSHVTEATKLMTNYANLLSESEEREVMYRTLRSLAPPVSAALDDSCTSGTLTCLMMS